MERWCPRCEWLGGTAAAKCPGCGTLLIDVPQHPHPIPDQHPADEVTAGRDGPARSSGGWRLGRTALVGVVTLAAAALALVVRIGSGSTPGLTVPSSLPDRLAFVAVSTSAGYESRVFFRQGLPSDPGGVDKGGAGALGRPYLRPSTGPEGGFRGIGFGWARDGRTAWVLSPGGKLLLVPGGEEIGTAPVRSATFSPARNLLAVCSEPRWPPRVQVVEPGASRLRVQPAIDGCFPRWSSDGVYLAYRLPSATPGTYRARWVGVLNTRLHVSFRVPAGWPATWATAPGYVFTPLTAVAMDGRTVEIMDPRGGRPRALVSRATLERLAGGPVAPIVSMAWSLEGDRLALALDNGPKPGRDGLIVVSPPSGRGRFIPWPNAPVSLSWAPGGKLLAEFRSAPSHVLTLEIRPAGSPIGLPGYGDGSWSPDGRWILIRGTATWFAIDADHPGHRVPIPGASSRWSRAAWCCPPVPVVRLEA